MRFIKQLFCRHTNLQEIDRRIVWKKKKVLGQVYGRIYFNCSNCDKTFHKDELIQEFGG